MLVIKILYLFKDVALNWIEYFNDAENIIFVRRLFYIKNLPLNYIFGAKFAYKFEGWSKVI